IGLFKLGDGRLSLVLLREHVGVMFLVGIVPFGDRPGMGRDVFLDLIVECLLELLVLLCHISLLWLCPSLGKRMSDLYGVFYIHHFFTACSAVWKILASALTSPAWARAVPREPRL